jgi:hypothetical protein
VKFFTHGISHDGASLSLKLLMEVLRRADLINVYFGSIYICKLMFFIGTVRTVIYDRSQQINSFITDRINIEWA